MQAQAEILSQRVKEKQNLLLESIKQQIALSKLMERNHKDQ